MWVLWLLSEAIVLVGLVLAVKLVLEAQVVSGAKRLVKELLLVAVGSYCCFVIVLMLVRCRIEGVIEMVLLIGSIPPSVITT